MAWGLEESGGDFLPQTARRVGSMIPDLTLHVRHEGPAKGVKLIIATCCPRCLLEDMIEFPERGGTISLAARGTSAERAAPTTCRHPRAGVTICPDPRRSSSSCRRCGPVVLAVPGLGEDQGRLEAQFDSCPTKREPAQKGRQDAMANFARAGGERCPEVAAGLPGR